MSTRTDVLLWSQRIVAMTSAPAHQLLEIKVDDSIEAAQDAFHKIARAFHPDIHRTGLSAEELETVTIAYSRCAGAYQDFRSQRMTTSRMRPLKDAPVLSIPGITPPPQPAPATTAPPPAKAAPQRTPPGAIPRVAATPVPGAHVPSAAQVTQGVGGSGAMNGKALIYYRKAELALRRGDLKNALMQVKMAIAGDPQSTFLRSALVEIEAELAKK